MFAQLVKFLDQQLGNRSGDAAISAEELQRAVAALCVEMARADMEEHPNELARAQKMLAQRFSLTSEQSATLLKEGMAESERAASLYRFVKLINQQFDADAKRGLLVMLWRLAYADGQLDKYEDALMHKLAELMYVPIVDLMRAKDLALQEK
ncbi:MAG: TerB family tellurite resistance protein [Gammaproteobacteria bacterium]|nr:TerB family tellurite resistance protein [Gammaproteobacteria bacterium]MDE1888236.1 TerB family tellurite resistance protein [Gammaproteobacteria bacterium]MDE2024567.1 TerB family tellurite resistance protein [Gammaproteobacteria bacterium]MDE2139541.1 TerB family tellurite resistance protein [Gammaproteobacteria bacterium]MDE2273486.1 TerB family tellurite resistance protein [Gammaproteobacteria bacterium]